MSNSDAEFAEHVLELMANLDGVTNRRMFGGYGIFREGLMFALIAGGELFLKADAENRGEFEALELPKFTYHKGEKAMHLSYYLCPEEAFQNSRAMRPWAESGWNAAIRADLAKPKSQRKRSAG